MQKFSDTVSTTGASGSLEVLSTANVQVYLAGTTTPATIFSTNTGTAKSNPFQSSSTGRIEFYAADGRYDLVISKAGYATVTVSDVLLEDPDNVNDDLNGVTISNSTLTNPTITDATIDAVTSLSFSATPDALTARRMAWNATEETLDLALNDTGVVLQVGQETHYHVTNTSGSTIANGTLVKVTGSQGNTGKLLVAPGAADGATEPKTLIGLVTASIGNGSQGFVTHFGKVRGIQTNGADVGETWVDGDILYASTTTPGKLTKVKPDVNGVDVVTVAIVINAHASNGTLFVRPTYDSHGANVVRYTPAGTGAVATNVQSKLREQYSVFDAGAKGDNVADDTAELNAAVAYVENTYDPAVYASDSPANGPSSLFFPAGFYRTTGTIHVTKKVAFAGDGPAEFSSGSRVAQFAPANDLFRITPVAQGMSVSFENMTLRGVGGGAGHLINVEKGLAGCNSQRYYGMVFGTPAGLALNIQAGDDIIIDNCLFDVAALSTIAFGTSAAANAVSNVRLKTPAFFAVNIGCIELYNIDGLQIVGAQVYPSSGSGRTVRFIDGVNTLPYQIRNVSIIGGTFKNVNSLVQASAVNNLKVADTVCTGFGAGTGATISGIELTGTCDGVSITGNVFSGSFDSKNFYNDAGAVVTKANITGNTFINTGGTGAALFCPNTTGVIANNTFIGFSTPSVSELVTTTGTVVSPGVIGSLAAWNYTATVSGARQGDRVEVGTVDTVWPVPIGVEVQAFVSAPNTVTVSYRNVTGGPIGVPAHDIRYCVTRGV